jgi:predicted nucleotidyltransferase
MAFAVSNAGLAAIEGARDRISDFCRRHRARRLSVFGSVLRDDFRSDSDIDLLVEFEPGHVPGLIRFAGMESELGEILGRKVDLLTPKSVSSYFRDRVLKDAVLLHDAA